MFKCKNCPYYYKGEDDDFCYCHFEGNFLAPCEEDDYEGEPYEDEDYDNMSDEDWEQELNDEEDFDDEKVFE